jgi:hypothetical protein
LQLDAAGVATRSAVRAGREVRAKRQTGKRQTAKTLLDLMARPQEDKEEKLGTTGGDSNMVWETPKELMLLVSTNLAILLVAG